MGEELVDRADDAQQLLHLRLPDLVDRGDLYAVLAEDRVLIGHLDQFGLLVHHEHGLREDGPAAGAEGRQVDARARALSPLTCEAMSWGSFIGAP